MEQTATTILPTLTTKSKLSLLLRRGLIVLLLSWMSLYPIYNSYYKANAVEHYQRHLDHIAGRSMFFNPWQYRILSPLMIEGLYWLADHTIFRIYEVRGVYLTLPEGGGEKNAVTLKLRKDLQNPEYIKYTIVFVGFRFLQNMIIFCLAYVYFSLIVRNKMLIAFGLMLATIFMGNGVMDADLTFNTYTDIILYLTAALVILKNYSPLWIVVLTLAGSLNRETSLMIPALYFFTKMNWNGWPKAVELVKNNFNLIIWTTAALIAYAIGFIAVRMYFGYEPVSVWRAPAGIQMLKFNLLSSVSIKTYMELFGVFGFMPLWCLLIFKKMSYQMKVFFILLVPVWFTVHLCTAVGYQTRLYLVPVLLTILPAVLQDLEARIKAGAYAQ
jgi:hypothetical protein